MMLEKIRQLSKRQWFFLFGLIVVIIVIYNSVLAITRIGETKVSIEVFPKDSKVTINDKQFSKKTVYLAPGEYNFSASAEGWKADTQTINIGQDKARVVLLPQPESDETAIWLKDNPDTQLEREKLGGERLDLQNQRYLERHPILEGLPYTEESPPFSIDFGPSKERKDDIFLIISDSTPNGRQAALDWIRQHGEDPTDLEIFFSDFLNPLAPKGEEHTH